ncbi:tyrosine-type recombinase/integrase [Halobacteriovorax marinus]|uniref:tyrosine-type recombinase/integrase n=1 Tax=Halobacteriovorax marinus TaxID=97084 RepID=UPI003A92384C
MVKRILSDLNTRAHLDRFGLDYVRSTVNREGLISKSWCKHKKGFVPPKNGTSRIVPMNKQLKTHLRELSLKSKDKGFVLPRNKSWMNGGATKVLQTVQSELGIKLTNYHSLRASFITHLLRSGMDIISVLS